MRLRLTLLLAACAGGLITVLPAGAAQSASGAEQGAKFYELVAYSATAEATLRDTDGTWLGESRTTARLGARAKGGYRIGDGTIRFNIVADVTERVRLSNGESCEESFSVPNEPAAFSFMRWGARVRALPSARYLRPGMTVSRGQFQCNRRITGTIARPKFYRLRFFKQKRFTLSDAGNVVAYDTDAGKLTVRYTTRYVIRRIR